MGVLVGLLIAASAALIGRWDGGWQPIWENFPGKQTRRAACGAIVGVAWFLGGGSPLEAGIVGSLFGVGLLFPLGDWMRLRDWDDFAGMFGRGLVQTAPAAVALYAIGDPHAPYYALVGALWAPIYLLARVLETAGVRPYVYLSARDPRHPEPGPLLNGFTTIAELLRVSVPAVAAYLIAG